MQNSFFKCTFSLKLFANMHFLSDIYNLFFPEVCLGCSEMLTENEKIICTKCNFNLPLCDYKNLKDNLLMTAFNGRVPLENAVSLMYYSKKGIVQNLIHNLKYKGHQEIGALFGTWLANEIKEKDSFKDIDYIILVPLHAKRFKERGYNQLDLFGEKLSEILDIPYETNLLLKTYHTTKQSKKNRFARMEKEKTIFRLNLHTNFNNKHFLIIDDIVTTGATIEACYDCLSALKNSKFSIAVMAFTK